MPKKGAKTYDTSLEECARKLGLEIVSNSSQLPTTYAMRNKQAHVPSTPLFAEKPPPGLTPGEEVEYKGLWATMIRGARNKVNDELAKQGTTWDLMSRPRSSLWGLWILSRDRYLAKYQDLVAQDKNAEDGDVEMEENDEEGEGEGEDGVDDADGDEVMAE